MAEAQRLTFEHGRIVLSGKELPGILVDLWVTGCIRWDEAQADQESGTQRMPQGWKDSEAHLSMELLTDKQGTCYEKLTALDKVFRAKDGKNPRIWDVSVNPHMAARGINRVVFNGLDSYESDESDTMMCTINLIEHRPELDIADKPSPPSGKSSAVQSTAPTAKTASVTADPEVTQDNTNPLLDGILDGMS